MNDDIIDLFNHLNLNNYNYDDICYYIIYNNLDINPDDIINFLND